MPIALVASGSDSNAAGASEFCGIPLPVGVSNGDLLLVAVALPLAGVVVTPPSEDWTQIVSTDPSQEMILSVWSCVALAPPMSLVFALSASCQTTGVVFIYRGVDIFKPIDAFAALLTASSTIHGIPGVTASQGPEEIALFIAGAASGTYTTMVGYQQVAISQQADGSLSGQHKMLTAPGVVAPTSETFSTAALGVAVIVALSPSVGTTTFDDAYQRVFEALPPGIDNVLDFTIGEGDFYKLTWVVGAALKLFLFDGIDLLRSEVVAYLSRYKLPDWEGLFNLRGTHVAQIGTIPQRQQQVLSSWRSAAGQGSSLPVVQAIMGPLLGYFPTTPVQIINADRSALTLAHSYDFCHGVDVTLNQGTTTTLTVYVNDGGKVAKMGAQLALPFSTADTTMMVFTLIAPDGTSKTWPAGTANSPLWLTAPELAGAQIQGQWTLVITNNNSAIGSFNTLYSSLQLFVEGIARGQQTAGAMFDWGVYADPAHIGENGTPPDFSAVRAAINRVKYSESVGNLIQSLVPYPNTDSGVHAAIPDECIPT